MNEIMEAALKPFAPPAQFKEGDIFKWRWTDEESAKRQKSCGSTVYWCMSQIAIFQNGRLRDTYWYGGSDSTYELELDKVVITFLGNPAEMKTIYDGERAFYRPEDVVDMNHANNSRAPVYVKGERNPETMRRYYHEQAERFEREIKMARDRIADCRNAVAAIDRGELTGSYFPVYR